MNRRLQGLNNYCDGLAAEEAVARRYTSDGGEVVARRWRGLAGEVDLIIRSGAALVAVEVKKAGDFARAAESFNARQLGRVMSALEEFVGGEPTGSLTPVRVDLAMVNRHGETEILENVSM